MSQLPEEAGERLLDLAAGKAVPTPVPPRDVAPLEHPDAQRRFRRAPYPLGAQRTAPRVLGYKTPAAEQEALAEWLRARRDEGVALHEIGLFARTGKLIAERITPALRAAALPSQDIKSDGVPEEGFVAVGTMHGAKGLEFRAVAIVGCDRNQLPLRTVASRLRDAADREAFIEQERHLLYVACTRASSRLRVTWSREGCEWLSAR